MDNRRSKIGWNQDFNIAIEVNGWENLSRNVVLWIDKRKDGKFVKINDPACQSLFFCSIIPVFIFFLFLAKLELCF